ncbi:MAG: AAA family ATPase [Pseudomonadota bacterium]
MSERFFLLTGCSSGGKSTLLDALAATGVCTVEEPGRRVVAGGVDPYETPARFAEACIACALEDWQGSPRDATVVFDRGILDAVSALIAMGSADESHLDLIATHRYAPATVFAPPWPEIYVRDGARRHGLEAAVEEYERLLEHHRAWGYRPTVLPKADVATRLAWMQAVIEEERP